MFYCRDNELSTMQQRYQSGRFECIVIYGRRRIGKTSLINEFCKDKPTIYFSALKASSQENLEALSKEIYSYKNPGSAGNVCFSSFADALDEITSMADRERIVFVIDEYPYLAHAEAAIPSRLQHLIDHKWESSKLYLILCGSSMSFMEHQVLGYESPLYGRRTAQIKLRSLSYREATVFYPELSMEDQSLMYGITGGIPHYINKLGVTDSIDDALLENLFNPISYLYEEPENLLKQELREPSTYNSIISAIAGGASRPNEIATKVGLESAICAKYLKVLLELEIIRKETPIAEKSGKKTIYQLADNFFRFWYRFVHRNQSLIASERMRRQLYEKLVRQFLPEYMGLVFENMCREYLMRYAEDLPVLLTDVGQWWGTDPKTRREVQIDIVGVPVEGNTYLVGSCKYKNEKIGVDELSLLKSYAEVFRKDAKFVYCIFSKGGFTEGLQTLADDGEVVLYTLEDMYKKPKEG